MSLCDTCRNPGRCCSGFDLNTAKVNDCDTPLEVLVALATLWHPDEWMGDIGLPFMPLGRRPNGVWMLWCPRLGSDGRCTDYENRPALCREFEPGKDRLCEMWEWLGVPEPDLVKEEQE